MYQVLSSTDYSRSVRNPSLCGNTSRELISLWKQALISQEAFPRDLVVSCAWTSNGSEMNLCHCCGHYTVGKRQRSHLSGDPKKITKQIPSAKIAGVREMKEGGHTEKRRNLFCHHPRPILTFHFLQQFLTTMSILHQQHC